MRCAHACAGGANTARKPLPASETNEEDHEHILDEWGQGREAQASRPTCAMPQRSKALRLHARTLCASRRGRPVEANRFHKRKPWFIDREKVKDIFVGKKPPSKNLL